MQYSIKSTICYLNGKYLPLDKAKISITDRGFQFSDGVYEVVGMLSGHLIDQQLHLKRLFRSLKKLSIKINLNINNIEQIIDNTIKKNKFNEGLIYLQITRGNQHPRDHKYINGLKPNILIYPIKKNISSFNELAKKGVKIISYPDIRWHRADIKSISLLGNVLAGNEAKRNGAHEAIFINEKGIVTEGNSTSVWAIKGKKCITHPLSERILDGCTRLKLISIIKSKGLILHEKKFNYKFLINADEVFITSASNLVMPVKQVDNNKVGNGKAGKISQELRELFIRAI